MCKYIANSLGVMLLCASMYTFAFDHTLVVFRQLLLPEEDYQSVIANKNFANYHETPKSIYIYILLTSIQFQRLIDY